MHICWSAWRKVDGHATSGCWKPATLLAARVARGSGSLPYILHGCVFPCSRPHVAILASPTRPALELASRTNHLLVAQLSASMIYQTTPILHSYPCNMHSIPRLESHLLAIILKWHLSDTQDHCIGLSHISCGCPSLTHSASNTCTGQGAYSRHF